MNINSSFFPWLIKRENSMKQKFVSIQTLQLTHVPDIQICKAHYYNFIQNNFSSGEINKSFTNNFIGGWNGWYNNYIR